MTRKSAARMRPAVHAAPRSAVVQSNKEARTSGGLAALLESATQHFLPLPRSIFRRMESRLWEHPLTPQEVLTGKHGVSVRQAVIP